MKNMKIFIGGALASIVICFCLFLFVSTLTSIGRDHRLATTPDVVLIQTKTAQTFVAPYTQTALAFPPVSTSSPEPSTLPTFELPTPVPTESVETCIVLVTPIDTSLGAEVYIEIIGEYAALACIKSVESVDTTSLSASIVSYLPDYAPTCSFYFSSTATYGYAYSNYPSLAQSFCDGVNK